MSLPFSLAYWGRILPEAAFGVLSVCDFMNFLWEILRFSQKFERLKKRVCLIVSRISSWNHDSLAFFMISRQLLDKMSTIVLNRIIGNR